MCIYKILIKIQNGSFLFDFQWKKFQDKYLRSVCNLHVYSDVVDIEVWRTL